jgi:beta-lactamase regulating signal transducer with metallopeptidase domain
MSRVALPWAEWMAAMSVQILVVVAAVALLERLFARRVRPRLAAALWLVALAKLLVPPTLESPMSVLPAISQTQAPPGLALAAFWIWLAGVVTFGSIAVLRHRRLRRDLLAAAVEVEPSVLVVPGLAIPCVLGYWRPVVLIPPGAVSEHAMLHEFTHIRRRDPLLSLAALAVQIVYWFHPASWLIRSRLAALREIGCDADVARELGDRAPEYRRLLAEVALRRAPSPTGVALGRGRIVERLEWLSARPSKRGRFLAPVAAALLLSACVPLVRPAAALFAMPTLDEARGCLQRRLVVLAALAQETSETKEKAP